MLPFTARLAEISGSFLGRPYLAHSLSPGDPEQLVTRTDGFDCVTYVETVLALARDPGDLPGQLRLIRYLGGRVRWADRNHYTSRWLWHNARARVLRRLLGREWVWDTPRTLTVLPGYPPTPWRTRYLPLDRVPLLRGRVRDGDVVAFVSTRADLDTFHVGLLTADLQLRHASRSAGGVVEQPLLEFLARNTLPGLLLARPLPPSLP